MDENYNVQEADFEDTIPENATEENEDRGNEEEGIVTPDDDELAEENVVREEEIGTHKSSSEKKDVSEPFVSVQYNHKNRDFTKDEAIKYIQKGMHTENLRAKLEYLAQSQGVDINTLVDRMVSGHEMLYKDHLERLYGKDSPDIEVGMQIYKQKQSDEYKKIMSESQEENEQQARYENLNLRLADEYMALKNEMPDAPEYSDLPDSVIIEAAKGNRDLFSAYLCYLYKERKKVEAAQKTQVAASMASSGKMAVDKGNEMTSSDRNFLLGLWSK